MGGQGERPSERRERVKSLDRMTEERKTPEMRAQMTDLERLRHSASHVLATAILKIWPEAQFAAGPPVENGFYYDVDLPHRISPDDFEKIEAEMKKEIDDYFAMLEEAKKRDHRKLGKELELFVFDDDVGPGLPMFLPRGAVIAEELEKLAKETEFAAGYQRVRTPHIARESLYKKSGHVPYYVESMFPPMEIDEYASERRELTTEAIRWQLTIQQLIESIPKPKSTA